MTIFKVVRIINYAHSEPNIDSVEIAFTFKGPWQTLNYLLNNNRIMTTAVSTNQFLFLMVLVNIIERNRENGNLLTSNFAHYFFFVSQNR